VKGKKEEIDKFLEFLTETLNSTVVSLAYFDWETALNLHVAQKYFS
jgi:hypothetical protein